MANDAGTRYGSGSSPIIEGNRVIVQNDRRGDSFLAAYDITTGRELWRRLWRTLKESHALPEAIDYVAAEYRGLTGAPPEG